jgi:hypothetical protein
MPTTHIPQMKRVKHLKTDLSEIQITSPKLWRNCLYTIAFEEKEENSSTNFKNLQFRKLEGSIPRNDANAKYCIL